MKIAVIGTGYVGLVTGTCFAETGNKVTCVDIDKSKVEKLSGGQITIYEPGLEKIFLRNIKEERLRFTTQLEEVVEEAEIIFLALPTPPGADGSADLKYVLGVADYLGKILKGYKVIVNKSTVPVGTADKVSAAIANNYSGEFDVVSNPEFLREGVAVDDFMKPDRVVVGTKSERAKKLMSDLYAPFVRQGNPVAIADLARKMIRLYGLIPNIDVNITYSGLRPGEKLYEELLNDAENSTQTYHEKILIAQVREVSFELVKQNTLELETILSTTNDEMLLVAKMKELVPEYISNNSIYQQLDTKVISISN